MSGLFPPSTPRSMAAPSVPLIDIYAIDPTSYNEFWVWCEKFSVPLGVARLTAVED